MLDEVSGLTFRGWDGGICIKCLQMGLNEKRVGKQKFEKGGGMLGKGVDTLKKGGLTALQT